jgi:acetolactate synthase-1/2/3 large subunit
MTKFTAYATEPHEAIHGLQLAYKHASLPRQGPAAVVLKTPIIRREMPDAPRVRAYGAAGHLAHTPPRPDPDAVAQLARWLAGARAPVFLAGNGAQNDRARALLDRIADRAGIAVATSYNGKGVVDETRPYAVGMLGTWGARSANRMLAEADLVVVLGASLGPDYLRFLDAALLDPDRQRIVQVDIDPRHAGWVLPVALAITADVADVLAALQNADLGTAHRANRLAAVAAVTRRWGFGELPESPAAPGTLHFADLVRAIDRYLTPNDLLTLDAGSNRIWMTSSLRVRTPGQLVVPGGVGGMGWGPPAAAAAKLVYPGRHVTCVVGDGGMAMTMAVLSTCVQEALPITVVVANNGGLGMVRDNQKGRRTGVDFAPMDFARIAEGMGCRGVRAEDPSALTDALAEARASGEPTLIDARIDPDASHVPISDY